MAPVKGGPPGGRALGVCVTGLWWNASPLAQGDFEITNMDLKVGSTLKIKGKIAGDANG